jgi:drug/metabolite transporter (DMT)-like permease
MGAPGAVSAAERRERLAVWAALLAQTLISAGTYLAAKRALAEMSPFALVLCRFILSAAVFALLLAILPGRALPPRAALPMTLFLGFLVGPLNQGLFFYGLARSVPAHSALLYALTPLGVYALSLARAQERPSRAATLGVFTALAGVLVLLFGRGLNALNGVFVGDLFVLCAVAAWVVYTTEGKRYIAAYGPMRATCWTMICGALWVLPLAPSQLSVVRVLHESPTALGCIVYLALGTSVVSYLLWYYALSRTEPSKVAIFSNLQPVLTALLAWLILGDPLTWPIVIGGGLVLLGVRWTQRG